MAKISRHSRVTSSFVALLFAALTSCATHPPIVIPDTPPEPVSIDIPKLGASSTLEPLGLNPDRSPAVPDVHTPHQAGYYAVSGVKPGQPGPPLVVIAHVDGAGQTGLFFNLKTLQPGDTASVKLTNGKTLTFRVTRVESDSKTAFPGQQVFGPVDHPTLRLVTCGGVFDKMAHSYKSNIVAYADLVV
jgi:hypothetical protein